MSKLVLKIYDHLEDISFSRFVDEVLNDRCRFYASDLMEALNMEESEEFEEIINIAERACLSLNIPVKHHFKAVFRQDESGLRRDFKLSHLACYLISINGDPVNPSVARAQIYFAFNRRNS